MVVLIEGVAMELVGEACRVCDEGGLDDVAELKVLPGDTGVLTAELGEGWLNPDVMCVVTNTVSSIVDSTVAVDIGTVTRTVIVEASRAEVDALAPATTDARPAVNSA